MDRHDRANCMVFLVVSLFFLSVSSGPCLAGEVTVFTPRKTAVSAYQSGEMPRQDIYKTDEAYEKIIKDQRWKAVIKASSSRQYNSHGYAWNVYAGGDIVNIQDKDVAKFWTDGSYQQIKRHEALRGDIIVMMDSRHPEKLHSAVVIDARWCMSKWADGPLVLHKLNDHPFGRKYRYYRRTSVTTPSGLTIVSTR